MVKFAMVIMVLMFVATAAFSQQSTRAQLDSCNVRLGDAQTTIRRLETENRRLNEQASSGSTEAARAISDANAERERAVRENQNLRTRVSELEGQNRELTAYRTQAEIQLQNLQTVVAENNRLATENMNLRNQAGATGSAVPTPAPQRFLYPMSGVLTNKSVQNVNGTNVIVSDFVFTNNGSRRVTSFDAMLRFYWQGNRIYEIQLNNVRNPAGAVGRGGTINHRAGLPIIDQNLVNATVESIDLVVEITNIQ